MCNYCVCMLQFGETALHIASEKGHTEIVQVLLSNGSDVNRQTKVNIECCTT